MEQLKSLQRADPYPSVRSLQIEAEGDPWKGRIKSKIRLVGCWLERAGFRPGTRVCVKCLAPGVIELRSPEVATVNEPALVSTEQLERPL
jgi:hypothetical protein